jgi:Protein of unknown function (DUF3631)
VSNEDMRANADLAVAYDPHSLSLARLLADLAAYFRRYAVITEHQADFCALWTLHTHCSEAAAATPYVHIYSPEPESGKTLMLELLELVVAEPVMIGAGATAAALARSAAKSPPPTLLLDESDNTFKRSPEYVAALMQVLNAGYRRGGRALLCLPPNWAPSHLEVFSPKAVAGLGKLPDTVASRSVPLEMQRKRRSETIDRFRRRAVVAVAEPLRLAASALAELHVGALKEAEPALPDELSDRQQDCWEPLLAVSDLAGGDWPERGRRAAVALHGSRDLEDASATVQLLAHIQAVFVEEKMSCADLIAALNEDEELPYGGWNEGAGIKTRELGRKLRPHHIKAKTIRTDEGFPKGYEREQFEDAWSRYLPHSTSETATTATTQSQSQKQAENKPPQAGDVAVSENASNPHEHSDVAVVAVSDPGYREKGAEPDPATASLDELRAYYGDAK